MIGLALVISSASALAQSVDSAAPSLHSFESDAELQSYLKHVASLASAAKAREDEGWGALCGSQFKVTHRSMNPGASASSRDVVLHVVVSDTGGTAVAGALLNVDDDPATGVTTDQKGLAVVRIPAEKLLESHETMVTARGMGYKYRNGHFEASPGDTIDIALSLCPFRMVRQQAVSTGAGSSGARDQFAAGEQNGVDEGSDTKLVGRILVILHRDRLYSIDLGAPGANSRTLRSLGFINVPDVGINSMTMRYDRFVVHGNRIIVLGYDVGESKVEVEFFRLEMDGALRREGAYQIRVNCKYSSCRARLAGDKLVLLAGIPLNMRSKRPLSSLPALRVWHPDSAAVEYRPLVTARRVYRFPIDSLIGSLPYLSSITTCDVATPKFDCEARVIVGPRDGDYHLSRNALYIWMHEGRDHPDVLRSSEAPFALFRVPLADSGPRALRITGGPFDQLELNENSAGSVRVFASGRARHGSGAVADSGGGAAAALLKLRADDFGDGTREAPPSSRRNLPLEVGENVRSRFLGRWLLYAIGGGYYRYDTTTTTLFAVDVDGGEPQRIKLRYYIERIAAKDSDAMIVASGGGYALHFIGIDLSSKPMLSGKFDLGEPSENERESGPFSYHASDRRHGILAVPGKGYARSDSSHWVRGSTSVVFARSSKGRFTRLGALSITPKIPESDSTEAPRSWYDDWYGNARGIFAENRIFALIGYELIEGQIVNGRIVERQRLNYMPKDGQIAWK